MSLTALSDVLAQVRTKKKEFLAEVERIVPWERKNQTDSTVLLQGRGNKSYDLEQMLQIYMIQNLYNLADTADCG